jgi:hypothetical protein
MGYRTIALLGCLAVAAAPCGAGDVRISHLYELSDFNGTVPYSDVVLHVDRQHDEVYAVAGNVVRVFNHAGMEIYSFQHDPTESQIVDLAVDEKGEILTLNLDLQAGADESSWWIRRCDYRGEPTARIEIRNLPADLGEFIPNRMLYRGGRFMLVDRREMQLLVVERSGRFEARRDLAELIGVEEGSTHELAGFDIDGAGNLLFTIPVLFRAYVVAPDGTVRAFGSAGSAPGKFGVVAGIVASEDGHYLVADKLRRVVMVFSPSLEFVTEYAGNDRWALSRPSALAVGNSGRLYVSQAQRRGVAVLNLHAPSSEGNLDRLSSTQSNANVRNQGL